MKEHACTVCKGTGSFVCPLCGGRREVVKYEYDERGLAHPITVACWRCGGTGYHVCPICSGTGRR